MLSEIGAVLLLFLVVSSGSIPACSALHRRFEDALPITVGGIIGILYFFGLIGLLPLGVFTVLIVGAGLTVWGGVALFRRRSLREFAANFFTPAFAVLLVSFLFFFWLNYGKLLINPDEFTFWGISVKYMFQQNRLATSCADLIHANYPPAMPLFLYFTEKLHSLLTNGDCIHISEGLLFFATHSFGAVFLCASMLRELSWKRPLPILLSAAVLLLVPTVFFDYYYDTILVDALLGLVTGAGWWMLMRPRDRFNDISFCMTLFTLSMMKNVGLILAAFLLAGWIYLHGSKSDRRFCLIMALCFIVPRLLWAIHLTAVNAVYVFNGSEDMTGASAARYLNHSTAVYRAIFDNAEAYTLRDSGSVLHTFFSSFLTMRLTVGFPGLLLPYIAVIGIFAALLVLSAVAIHRFGLQSKRPTVALVLMLMIQLILYAAGVCIAAMFVFTTYEDSALPSFFRYMCTAITPLLVVLGAMGIRMMSDRNAKPVGAMICLLLCFTVPFSTLLDSTPAYAIPFRHEIRDEYDSVCERMLRVTGNTQAKIMLVSQQENRDAQLIMRYDALPNRISIFHESTFGSPTNESTESITADELREYVLAEQFDYLLLLNTDEDFTEKYHSLFADPDSVVSRGLYAVRPDDPQIFENIAILDEAE